MTSEPIDIAKTFFAHWSANRIDEAIAMLSEDVLYDNVPFPDIVGRENVRRSCRFRSSTLADQALINANRRFRDTTHIDACAAALP